MQKMFLEWMEEELDIWEPMDWMAITWDKFKSHRGGSMLNLYGSIKTILSTHYPNIRWNFNNNNRGTESNNG
jgi:hypothetical protein